LSSAASANPTAGTTTCTGTLAPGTYQKVVVPAGATCSSTGLVRIRGGLFIDAGATFVLGSEASVGSTGTISGGVHGTNAASVQIHGANINGGLRLRGGSGLGSAPPGNFDAIELNHVNGGATVTGYDGVWFGFIGNKVNGSVNLNDNVSTVDPDSNEFVTNTINGSLNCTGNSPAAHVGDSTGGANAVTGQQTGQCTPPLAP
jgi:hypothetical protein